MKAIIVLIINSYFITCHFKQQTSYENIIYETKNITVVSVYENILSIIDN